MSIYYETTATLLMYNISQDPWFATAHWFLSKSFRRIQILTTLGELYEGIRPDCDVFLFDMRIASSNQT